MELESGTGQSLFVFLTQRSRDAEKQRYELELEGELESLGVSWRMELEWLVCRAVALEKAGR